jgi:LmbE family N-acetylglucosaminyl deacetylase
MAGYEVTLLSITSGELGGDSILREAEEKEAADRLGASATFGYLADGSVTRREAIDVISSCVNRIRPSIVFAHDPSDTHQDHVNVAGAAMAACRNVPNVFLYEGPSSSGFQPTTVNNVSATWQRKLRALDAYATQMHKRDLLSWVVSAASFRAWPRHVGSYCESFRVAHAELPLPQLQSTSLFQMERAFAVEA